MKYTINETVEIVGWTEALSNAPADMVKQAKEMSENNELVSFAKVLHITTPPSYTWCLVGLDSNGSLMVVRRYTTKSSS